MRKEISVIKGNIELLTKKLNYELLPLPSYSINTFALTTKILLCYWCNWK